MPMSKSTYYYEISKEDVVAVRNKEILDEIKSIFESNRRRYGVKRIHQELVNRGYHVNHKRVQRLMHEAGLMVKPNEIISYDLSMSPNLEQIARMLNKAFEKFPSVEGLIFHSNQGWQYQHAYYRNVLKEHGIIQSMSRIGNCYDNCIMETFFGRLKNEMYYGYEKEYSSFEEFSKAVEEYIDYYNNKRIQAKTKWMPPVQYRIASMCST